MVLLGEVLVHEGARRPELVEDGLRADGPVEPQRLARPRADSGEGVLAAEDPGVVPANADDRRYSGYAPERVLGLGRDRREVVLRRDRVVGGEYLVDGVEEGGADARREHRHEGDESEADHQ